MTVHLAVVRDVFRQAWASGLTFTLMLVALLATVACLTVQFQPEAGSLTLFAGNVPVIDGVNQLAAVQSLQFILGGIICGTIGLAVALVWTASFLPSLVDPSAASVLLAKPVSRTSIFLTRFVAVLLFIALFGALLVGGTAVAIGIRTGEWDLAYWQCVPLLVAQFAVFYSFSALLAVMTKNASGCLVGSILFWLLCWAMNYGRHSLVGLNELNTSRALIASADVGYWALPKPADFGFILQGSLHAEWFPSPLVDLGRVQQLGYFHPVASVLTSLAAAFCFLSIAAYEFAHEDY